MRFFKDAFVLVGAPDDRGVAIVGGRVGSAKGPETIRKELAKLPKIPTLEDGGDVAIGSTQQETYENLEKKIAEILGSKAFPILIGGGHDLSCGGLKGFLRQFPNGGVINIDPHFDCRPSKGDGTYSSGSAFRRLLEEKQMDGKNFVEFGFQMERNHPEHYQFLKSQHVHLVPREKLTEKNIGAQFQKIFTTLSKKTKAVALTFDMDAIDAAYAPGVSALNVNGFTSREALQLIHLAAKNKRLKYLDLMEVNPLCDPDHRTARLAALMIYQFLIARKK